MIPVEVIGRKIYLIRGEKVMLDSDLAVLFYEVETFNLNKAVKRNIDRFPEVLCSDSPRKKLTL